MSEGEIWLILSLATFMAGWTHVAYIAITHDKKNKRKKLKKT